MPDKFHALRSALIAALLPAIVAGKIGPSGVGQPPIYGDRKG